MLSSYHQTVLLVMWIAIILVPLCVRGNPSAGVVEAIPCGSKAVTVPDFFEQTCPSQEARRRYPSSTLGFNCTRLNISALLSHVHNPSEMSSSESASLKLYWKYSNAAQMGAPWNTSVPLAHLVDLENLDPDILASVFGQEVLTILQTGPDGATVVKDSLGKDVCSGITDDEQTNCKFQAILRIPYGRNKVCHIRSMFIGVKIHGRTEDTLRTPTAVAGETSLASSGDSFHMSILIRHHLMVAFFTMTVL